LSCTSRLQSLIDWCGSFGSYKIDFFNDDHVFFLKVRDSCVRKVRSNTK
jgi:hypothetical protein